MTKSATTPPKAPARFMRTVTLLGLMMVVGVLSSMVGYLFGQNALKGTTQPVVNPILGVSGSAAQRDTLRKESDILAEVKARTSGLTTPPKKEASSSTASPSPESSDAPQQPGLPVTSSAEGVTLEVSSIERQTGNLVLNVSLKNAGSKPVQFVYTQLEVKDNNGRSLTAVTRGLPPELPVANEAKTGTISIPETALKDTNQLSLSLSDYPDQNLRLQISNINIPETTPAAEPSPTN